MLTPKVASWFDDGTRGRGDRYAADGRVKELLVSRDYIGAMVRGTHDYDVLISIIHRGNRWDLVPNCTCEYADAHEQLCKHVWATLRAAERLHLATLGPIPADVRIESGQEANVPVSDIFSLASLPPAKRPKPPKPPAWMKVVERSPVAPINRFEQATGPIGELMYIVDLERSKSTESLCLALGRFDAADKQGRPRKAVIRPSDISRMTDEADRAICGMLMGAGQPLRSFYYSDSHAEEQRNQNWCVNLKMLGLLGPMLHGTGRLRWRVGEKSEAHPLEWDGGEPWRQTLAIVPADHSFVLTRELRRGPGLRAERLVVSSADLLITGDPGVVIHDGRMSLAKVAAVYSSYGDERQEQAAIITPDELPALLSMMEQRRIDLPLVWPESWPVREVADLPPRGRVTLRARRGRGDEVTDKSKVEVAFEYGEEIVREGKEGSYLSPRQKDEASAEIMLIRRQRDVEARLVERLGSLKVKPIPYGYEEGLQIDNSRIPALVGTLLLEGWTVLGDAAQYRRAGDFTIEVSSGIDWFNLNGHCEFEGQRADISEILRALKSGERFVRLGDGSMGMLPEQWLSRHERWLRLGEIDGDAGVKFSKAQLGIVDALLAELPEATCDVQVATARKKLAGFEGVRPRREPKAFVGTLRDYQREGLGWLRFLKEFGLGGILADDMGLGKTVQLLAHVLDERAAGEKGPWLIVAPKSLVFNWAREAEKFAPGLQVVAYAGLERKDRSAELADADLVLTTYATMRLDIEKLREVEFACAVLDEAQAIKNADAQVAKAARLIKARRRLALTGTPVENRLTDLWSLMEFLNPGMLGGAAAFRDALGGREADLSLLRRAVRPFILRRTKDKVAKELPSRSEQTIVCDLGKEQRSLYDGLLKHYRDSLLGSGGRVAREGMKKSKIQVLEALLRLRQAACHPALIEVKPLAHEQTKAGRAPVKPGRSKKGAKAAAPTVVRVIETPESAKVEVLVEMLEELTAEGESEGGHKALVFSQFTSLLALVRAQLDSRGVKYEYLDGKTTARNRAAAVDRFQTDDSVKVFLISLKAGGVGLNLTAADYVFLLDPWWNPAVEAQAIDRTHRIGQTRKVIAYRLIAKDTVEERIQQLQTSKRELAAAIVAEQEGPLSSMTREDLSWLLS